METWWQSGIQSINCLDCSYILEQYTNIKHNLLYKIWTAGGGGVFGLKIHYYSNISVSINFACQTVGNETTQPTKQNTLAAVIL
jgi:hypothetical protein